MRILDIGRQLQMGAQSDGVVRRSPCILDRLLTTDRLISLAPYALVLIAFALRVLRLDFQPIWFDEDLAYQRATASWAVSLASMAGSPLYYIGLRGWVEVFGSSLYAMRFFSAVFGTLAVPLTYQVGRRLFGKQLGLGLLLIATFAPFYIYYSQEARTYSLTLVLMLMSMYTFLRWREKHRAVDLLWCSLANLICLYTHYVAVLVIIVQSVIVILTHPFNWRKIIWFGAAQVLVCAALIPWLLRVEYSLPRVLAPPDSTAVDPWSLLARTWTEFSVGRTLAPPFSLYLAIVPLFLALAGLFSLFARHDISRSWTKRVESAVNRSVQEPAGVLGPPGVSTDTRMILLAWLIVPIVGTLLIPRASVRFSPKYLIAITPVFYVSIVLGLNALRSESRQLIAIGLIGLVSIWLYALGDYYLRPHDKLAQLPKLVLEARVEQSTSYINKAGLVSANQETFNPQRSRT